MVLFKNIKYDTQFIYATVYDMSTWELSQMCYHRSVKIDWHNEIYYIEGVMMQPGVYIEEYHTIRRAMPYLLSDFKNNAHSLPDLVEVCWG